MRIIAIIFFLLIPLIWMDSCSEPTRGENDFLEQRRYMVKEQIEARGIKDKQVLNAMLKVERHLFVPPNFRHLAYADRPLPIGHDQTISQPYIVALMTQALILKENEKVLEVGTGSGYQAAILAELAKEVYTVEIIEPLAKRAKSLLKQIGYENIYVRCGDGYFGWKEAAPFDAIIITCASSNIPGPLLEQLADGGRMILPVDAGWGQDLILVRKKGEVLKKMNLGPVLFVPMTGKR